MAMSHPSKILGLSAIGGKRQAGIDSKGQFPWTKLLDRHSGCIDELATCAVGGGETALIYLCLCRFDEGRLPEWAARRERNIGRCAGVSQSQLWQNNRGRVGLWAMGEFQGLATWS